MTAEPSNTQQDNKQSKRDAINKCIALKEMPHIFKRLEMVWGYPEFFDYIDSLLLMEPGREDRAGLPFGAYKEIDALERIFIKFPDEVMHPSLNRDERTKIHQLINERAIKINYTTGDRR
jgi:hypothetical protein